MKPFNLEEALAGKPVVTRAGKPVTQLTLFNSSNNYPLHGVIDGYIEAWTQQGNFNDSQARSGNDLFMVPVKRDGWINILRNQSDGALIAGARVFEAREQAGAAIYGDGRHVATIKIEW
jgi:hypothetical protein